MDLKYLSAMMVLNHNIDHRPRSVDSYTIFDDFD